MKSATTASFFEFASCELRESIGRLDVDWGRGHGATIPSLQTLCTAISTGTSRHATWETPISEGQNLPARNGRPI
jgi:hypothetical protein